MLYMGNRKGRKHRGPVGRSSVQKSWAARASIQEAQDAAGQIWASRVTEVGGRFGELAAKALSSVVPIDEIDTDAAQATAPALSPSESEELRRIAPEARSGFAGQAMQNISELRGLFAGTDPFVALSVLSARNLWFADGTYYEPTNHGSEVRVELAAGLILTTPRVDRRDPTSQEIQRVLDLIEQTIDLIDLSFGAELMSSPIEDAAVARYRLQRRRLFMRGDCYVQHAEQTAMELYSGRDAELLKALGFRVSDLLTFTNTAIGLITDRVNDAKDRFEETLSRTTGGADRTALVASGGHATGAVAALERFPRELAHAMSFTPQDLLDADSKLSAAAVVAMLERLSVETGSLPEAEYSWPLDPHPLERKPVVRDGRRYSLPLPGLLHRRSAEVIEAALAERHPGARTRNSRLLEGVAVSMLASALPGASAYRSLFYESGGRRCETDGLIAFEDRLLVVEAKHRPFSSQAERGDVQRLKRDFDASVVEALRQGLRVRDLLLSGKAVSFEDRAGREVLRVPGGSCREAWVINPNLTPILDLGAQPTVAATLAPGVELTGCLPIYINDLRLVVELSETPAHLIHYLRWRSAVPLERLAEFEEADLFGAYLAGVRFTGLPTSPDAEIRGYFTVQFDDYYINALSGHPGPRPRRETAPSIRRLVKSLCNERPVGWLDAALTCLDLTSEQAWFVERRLRERTKLAGVFVEPLALIFMPPGFTVEEAIQVSEAERRRFKVDRVLFARAKTGRWRLTWASTMPIPPRN